MNGRRWRRWLVPGLVVLGGVAALRVYGLGPGGSSRAQLQLLALDADSRFAADALLQRDDPTADGPARFPLIFAVQNSGTRAAAPDSLFISLPSWIRLLGADGLPRPVHDEGGTLVRHALALHGEAFEPGALPLVPGGIDRLWLAPELPAISCSVRWDGVIEFVPAPDYDVERLATIDAFFSLESREDRHAGLLRLRIDPDLLRSGDGDWQAGPVTVRRPSIALPNLGGMALEGIREGSCGAPELNVQYRSIVWRTGSALTGRFIGIQQNGAPRRLIYDINGDGRIDFEAWDGDRDGQFEAGRTASWSIPSFLLPLPTPVTEDTIRHDTAPADSIRPDSTMPELTRPDSGQRATAARDTTQRQR